MFRFKATLIALILAIPAIASAALKPGDAMPNLSAFQLEGPLPDKLKGNVILIGRDSPHSLYDQDLVTFEEGAVANDHNDAGGFIKLNALRLRTLAKRKLRAAKA